MSRLLTQTHRPGCNAPVCLSTIYEPGGADKKIYVNPEPTTVLVEAYEEKFKRVQQAYFEHVCQGGGELTSPKEERDIKETTPTELKT